MGRAKRLYVCASCGHSGSQWTGRCAGCGAWGSVEERAAAALAIAGTAGGAAARIVDLASELEEQRIPTGFPGIDRVLGGGLVPGSVVLLAGAPGIGKSTLLLQLASRLAGAGRSLLLASGEETRGQVAARARRLGVDGAGLAFVPGRDVGEVVAAAVAERPAVLAVDSVHTLRDPGIDGAAGGPAQVRACVDALVGLAKEQTITTLLVGHVTKAGDLAGPRTIEHAVDVVLSFEGEARSGLRVLAGGKNRFGPEGEVAWFEMASGGLAERASGPAAGHGDGEPGCATAAVLAGRRGYAVEVQALVVASDGPPRRQVTGLDGRRFHIVAAVTERATGLRLTRAELFGASSGGFRVDEPGADLAVAAALASAAEDRPLPERTAFAAEVSLTGALRPVGSIEGRAAAAQAAGASTLVCAAAEKGPHDAVGSVRLVRVPTLRSALAWAGLTGSRRRTAGPGRGTARRIFEPLDLAGHGTDQAPDQDF